jgi:hypothetical protein
MLKLFREEYCKNCVKLVRAIWAIGLDAIIVFVVVQVAIGTSYVVDHELKGASYESSVNWAHHLLTVLTILVCGIVGIFDVAVAICKSTSSQCSE